MKFDFFNSFSGLNSTQKGQLGEAKAEKYLKKNGFKIIVKNYRKPWGEIDIVAKRKGRTHFVEVKSLSINTELKTDPEYYGPEDNLHEMKIKKLTKIIETYCLEKEIGDNWQVDAILIRLDKNNGRILSLEYWPEII